MARKKSKDGSNDRCDRMGKAEYMEKLAPLQLELNRLARWVQTQGQRVLVLVEGRDTAGKGGAIAALSDTLNPRQCRVVALGKPATASAGSGISSAMCPICPPPARSC